MIEAAPTHTATEEELITLSQASEILDAPLPTVQSLIRRGELPVVILRPWGRGERLRVKRAAVERLAATEAWRGRAPSRRRNKRRASP